MLPQPKLRCSSCVVCCRPPRLRSNLRIVASQQSSRVQRMRGCAGLAAALSFALAVAAPQVAMGRDLPTAPQQSGDTTPIYFGNGCFWGRQHDFIEAERKLGRDPQQMSAVVGYAGGQKGAGPGNKVCYYYANDAVYEELGHAEVVSMQLRGGSDEARRQMEAFADTYFSQFKRTPWGMMRSDPQDAGPAYRNVVGLPGGVNSDLYRVLQERNVNGMQLVAGDGDNVQQGKHTETDKFNTIYVVDSTKLPFYQGEMWHQMHDGIGKPFPKQYKSDLKQMFMKRGIIKETGCPELRM